MKSSSNLNDPNIFKCKICTEMVEIDFNYDSLMSNGDNLNKIKNYFTDSLGIDETIVNEQLGKDNLEFMTKEISMQYFFKGSESSGGSNIKECKAVKSDKCDKLKSNLCEDVVGLNRGDCNLSLIKRDNIKPKNNQMVNKKNSLTNDIIDNNNPIDIMAIIAKNAKNSGSLDLNSMLESGKNMMSNMNSSNKLKRLKSKAAINNPPKFRQVNAPLTNDYNVSEDASQYNNMSLLDISSPQMNMADLQDDPHEDVKKTFWSPPKPVLLDNFQNNLGTQLKDISLLTTEITKLENKLKVLKQELANKIETAQSSYVAIQKTLTEISKLPQHNKVNTKTESCVTDDDWDENSKPKFLNNMG